MVISVPRVLSVFHFSVKVRPYSDLLYLVSRLPTTLLVSVLEEPEVLNSYRDRQVFFPVISWIQDTMHPSYFMDPGYYAS